MKIKPIQIFIIALAIWFAGDRGLSFVLDNIIDLSHNRFALLYSKKANADVILLGNSRMDRHFDVKMTSQRLKKQALNLGTGGESALLSLILLKDYINFCKYPKVIILEVSNLLIDQEGVKDFRLFGQHSKGISNLLKTEYPFLYYSGKVAKLYTYNNNMFFRIIFEIIKTDNNRLRKDTISESSYNRTIREKKVKIITGKHENMQALKEIVKICNDHNIDLKVIITPHIVMANNSEKYKDWKLSIKKIIGENKVWDFSDTISDRQYFFDKNHLNKRGVKLLFQYLEKENFFYEKV